MPQIEVTFDIDANGILNVSAKDHATNKEQKITITASTGLSKDEAERMRREAESHSDEDKKRLAEIEARNQLDNRIYQSEKLLRENREKVSESDAKAVEAAIEAGRKAMSDNNADAMKAAGEQIERAMHSVAEAMYKATAAQGAAAGGTGTGQASGGPAADGSAQPGGQKQGDVIDAEYVDVDESKKPN
jgi:molecular chaperone DnaK